MKKIILVLFMLAGYIADAQTIFNKASYIEPYRLEITANKTTNLVFPASILSIDRGSQDVIVQKAAGVENILRVKADTKAFAETNLSIITSDGKLYSFLISYTANPPYLNIDLSKNGDKPVVEENIICSDPALNENNLAAYAAKASHSKNNIHSLDDESSKVSLDVNGFYIKDNVLFCKIHLQNASQINYDIEQLRFYIKDKKLSNRTSAQEIEIKPVYISGDTSVVKGKSAQLWVVALPKFTIPDGKYLNIEVMEKNGGRHLSIQAKNRHVLKAKTI
jgi:conjugative transposon TraN protein